MKRMLRLFRRTSGFTLVEMIVSVALLAILMGGMMVIVSPIVSSFNDTSKDLAAENTATCVQEYITKSIRNANQVLIVENTSYNALSANTAATDKIAKMNTWCSGVNGAAVNKTYLLKCISLRYDETKNNYFLYDESVKMNDSGKLDTSKSRLVFSECLYDDLYFTYDFSKVANADPSGNPLRDDAINMRVQAYRDSARSSLAFVGTGVTELRQVKVMLAAGASADDYNSTIIPASPKAFADTEADGRDIFIYYVVRNYTVN